MGSRKGLVGNWGSYSGDIVYFVLFKEYIWGLIHITANCNESHIKLLETCFWPYAIVAGWYCLLCLIPP